MARKSRSPNYTGVPGIRRRGHNRYQIRVSMGRDADGKPRLLTEQFRGTLRDATARRAQLIADKSKGQLSPPSRQTVEQFMDGWLRVKKGNVRESTYAWYEKHTRLRIRPGLGSFTATKLTGLQIESFYADLREAGASDTTITGTHRTLRAACRWGAKKKILAHNPMTDVEPPGAATRKKTTLTRDQVTRFLDHIRGHRYYTLYLAATTTGMRQGELFGLRWQDVDLKRGVIRVTQRLEKPGRNPVFREPKTAQGRRAVKLPQALREALADWRVQQRAERKALGDAEYYDYDLVFCQPNGRPLHANHIDATLHALQEAAGVPRCRFHDLRHTHATLLADDRIHPRVVQERLGHTDVRTTLMMYTDVWPTMQDTAADSMDSMLGAKSDREARTDESDPENPSET